MTSVRLLKIETGRYEVEGRPEVRVVRVRGIRGRGNWHVFIGEQHMYCGSSLAMAEHFLSKHLEGAQQEGSTP